MPSIWNGVLRGLRLSRRGACRQADETPVVQIVESPPMQIYNNDCKAGIAILAAIPLGGTLNRLFLAQRFPVRFEPPIRITQATLEGSARVALEWSVLPKLARQLQQLGHD